MAGNTRGRLKERFEGIHKNFEWVKEHCSQSLILIGDKSPKVASAITALLEGIDHFDKLAQDIYAKL
jgi:hypothetical protein